MRQAHVRHQLCGGPGAFDQGCEQPCCLVAYLIVFLVARCRNPKRLDNDSARPIISPISSTRERISGVIAYGGLSIIWKGTNRVQLCLERQAQPVKGR